MVILIIAIAALAYFFVIQPQQAEARELETFKKALFDSTLCQYSCPLEEQFFQERDQLLPTRECINACIAELTDLNLNAGQFSDFDLAKDDLVGSIEETIVTCREGAQLNETEIDNEAFFSCAADGLSSIKSQYPYLA